MAPAHDAAGLLYDPADPRYRIDPYPLYARLREADPVHWSPLGFWVLTRYADIDCAHRDPRCGGNPAVHRVREDKNRRGRGLRERDPLGAQGCRGE